MLTSPSKIFIRDLSVPRYTLPIFTRKWVGTVFMTLVGNFVRTSCSDPQASKGRRWARWPGGLVLSLGLQEGIDAYQVDGRGKTDVMQMGLRETAIGRL